MLITPSSLVLVLYGLLSRFIECQRQKIFHLSIWQVSIHVNGFYLPLTAKRAIFCSVTNNEVSIRYYLFVYHKVFDVADILRYGFDGN